MSKVSSFSHTPCRSVYCNPYGVTRLEFYKDLWCHKLDSLDYRVALLADDIFSHFNGTPTWDGCS